RPFLLPGRLRGVSRPFHVGAPSSRLPSSRRSHEARSPRARAPNARSDGVGGEKRSSQASFVKSGRSPLLGLLGRVDLPARVVLHPTLPCQVSTSRSPAMR